MTQVLKLGKKPATYDKRDAVWSWFRQKGILITHPAQFGDEDRIPPDGWGMDGNDTVGNCVFAGGDHETLLWTAEGGNQAQFSAQTAISDYSAVTGYNPNATPDANGNNPTDQGTDVRTALGYRQQTGLIDVSSKRHLIGAYLALEPGNIDHLLDALYLFNAVGIGLQFPNSAMDQFGAGKPWSVVSGAQVEGGHYVPLVANRGNLVCVTWGRLQQMTLQFYEKYCDEAWAILSPEMLAAGKSPEGFDLPALQAYLQEVA